MIALSFISFAIFGQSPGGVMKPILWQKTFNSENSREYGVATFNYHPYKYFSESLDFFKEPLNPLKKVSLFVVFSSNQPSEIARMNTGLGEVILNDSSIVSRTTLKYQETFNKPKFISYQDAYQPSNKLSGIPSFVFGKKENDGKWFEGGVAELIVYDRLISKDQRLKVESYLSMKYGISLPDSSNYFNSDSKVIWDARKHSTHKYNVTCIGRDDESGLYQKQSHNLYSDIDLSIGIEKIAPMNESNEGTLKNQSYLFWADDNKEAKFEALKYSNNIAILKRTWQVFPSDNRISSTKMELKLDPKNILNYNESLGMWLVVNRETKNGININSADIIKMKKDENGNFIASVLFDSDESGSDNFTFIQAPDIYTNVAFDNIACDEKGSKIDIKIFGFNNASMVLKLKSEDRVLQEKDRGRNANYSFDKVDYGEYTLVVSDKEEDIYSQKLLIDKSQCLKLRATAEDYLYPNPVSAGSVFNLSSTLIDDNIVSASIFNAEGKLVKTKKFAQVKTLNYSDIIPHPGIYHILVKGLKKNKSYKIVVF